MEVAPPHTWVRVRVSVRVRIGVRIRVRLGIRVRVRFGIRVRVRVMPVGSGPSPHLD